MTSSSQVIKAAGAAVTVAGVAWGLFKILTKAKPAKPGINDHFMGDGDPSEFVAKFEVESREIFNKRDLLTSIAGLKKGDVVADLGAGTGLFMSLLADAVGPSGTVYCVEPFKKFHPMLEKRKAELEAKDTAKLVVVASTETDIKCPEGSLDVAFSVDAYHHYSYFDALLKNIKKALKPSGRLVIVDFEREPGVSTEWVLGHVRCGKRQVWKEVEAAGFKLVKEDAADGKLSENWASVFVKA